MTTEDFVRNLKAEKERLLDSYFSGSEQTAVGTLARQLATGAEATAAVRRLLDLALTDAFYTILLGLDGCTSLGDAIQQSYQIRSEDGSDITAGGGELEALAYEHFQI